MERDERIRTYIHGPMPDAVARRRQKRINQLGAARARRILREISEA